MKEDFLKMFHFLLKRTYESKPINKGYRDNRMNLKPDNKPTKERLDK